MSVKKRNGQHLCCNFQTDKVVTALISPGKSWKSASGLIVSQTDAFDSGGYRGSKSKLKLIGTGIQEVCEWSGSVADRRFRLGSVLGVEIYA